MKTIIEAELVGCDGKKIEAYLLVVFKPVEEYEGRLIGIICSEEAKEKNCRSYEALKIMGLSGKTEERN